MPTLGFQIISNKDLLSGKDVIKLVQSFTPIKSSIYIEKNGRKVNAKSILGLLSAGIIKGETLMVWVFGDDMPDVKDIFTKFFNGEL